MAADKPTSTTAYIDPEGYEGRAPVQTLDATLFETVGAAQPVDILRSLTANTDFFLATQQN